MRTKTIIEGLKNTQKFRVILNGVFIGDCQVKDLMGSRFCQKNQRLAVWKALDRVAVSRRVGTELIQGYGAMIDGIAVQVDLV